MLKRNIYLNKKLPPCINPDSLEIDGKKFSSLKCYQLIADNTRMQHNNHRPWLHSRNIIDVFNIDKLLFDHLISNSKFIYSTRTTINFIRGVYVAFVELQAQIYELGFIWQIDRNIFLQMDILYNIQVSIFSIYYYSSIWLRIYIAYVRLQLRIHELGFIRQTGIHGYPVQYLCEHFSIYCRYLPAVPFLDRSR